MDLGLNNATAVVTGGSKGMGRAIGECLAAEGARVAALARGKETLDETVEALRAAGSPDPIAISTDVTKEESVLAAFDEVGRRWGALNVLVNTVGPGGGTLDELDDRGWQLALELGTIAAVRCVRAALPLMRQAMLGSVGNLF